MMRANVQRLGEHVTAALLGRLTLGSAANRGFWGTAAANSQFREP